jgi:hypothetical protein
MASVGHGHYVVVVLHVVASKASGIKFVLHREPSSCDEYSHATVHCMTLYMYSLRISIRAFPQDGRIFVGTSLLQYCNGADATVRPVPPGTYRYA